MTNPPYSPQNIEILCDAIAERRSLGLTRLKPDPVDPAIIQKALEAANWAPSNGDTEPWRFSIFTGESRKKLGAAFGEAYRIEAEASGGFRQETFESTKARGEISPVWISIGMTPGLKEDGSMMMSEDEEIMAVACAVQNLHLVLAAHGLIGMWVSKGAYVHKHVAKFLGLESPSRLLGFFFCGWPNVPWPAGERQPLEKKITWHK